MKILGGRKGKAILRPTSESPAEQECELISPNYPPMPILLLRLLKSRCIQTQCLPYSCSSLRNEKAKENWQILSSKITSETANKGDFSKWVSLWASDYMGRNLQFILSMWNHMRDNILQAQKHAWPKQKNITKTIVTTTTKQQFKLSTSAPCLPLPPGMVCSRVHTGQEMGETCVQSVLICTVSLKHFATLSDVPVTKDLNFYI